MIPRTESESQSTQTMDATDPARFIATARQSVVAELVEGMMGGTRLLAVTAPAGAGKTTLVSAVAQELASRSVRLLCIDHGSADILDLRALTCQLLGKQMAEFSADDIEALFDVLTTQQIAGERRVLIIDGAERLGADVLGYLRLLSSMAAEEMPRILVFARPSLWDTAEPANRADVRELITDRRELRLLDADEAIVFAKLSLPQAAFGEGALDALVRHGEGLIGKLAALLAFAGAITEDRRLPQVTADVIDMAAARLDAGETVPAIPQPAIAGGSRRRVALLPALVALPIVLGPTATGYWWLASQPHLLARAEPVSTADAAPSSPSQPATNSGTHTSQIWALADLLDSEAVGAAAEANDTSAARQEARADAVSESIPPADQSVPPEPSLEAADQPAVGPTTTAAPEAERANEAAASPAPAATVDASQPAGTAADAPIPEHVGDARASAALPAAMAEIAAPVAQSVIPEPPAPIDETLPQHVGDVREAPALPAAVAAKVTPLLERGDALLALGDIAAARLFYERAAALGNAQAATSLGKTYDPGFLVTINAAGTAAIPGLAAKWYRKAARLGDLEAARRLATVTAGQ